MVSRSSVCRLVGLVGALAALALGACNYTEGQCVPRGQGGSPGAGGGPIVPGPGQGGFGDVPPEPQNAGDVAADPCNVTEGRNYYCSGVISCTKVSGDFSGPAQVQCAHDNTRQTAAAPGQALEILITACGKEHPGYSCAQNTLECGDQPRSVPASPRFLCNGGVTCTDSKGFTDGCTYNAEEVYADDAQDAADLLVEICEDNLHDKTGNNCDHGGFCCTQGSLTCNKAD